MAPFERLTAWQKAHALTRAVLHALDGPPAAHRQVAERLRLVAMAIPLRIIEGTRKETPEQFAVSLALAEQLVHEATYLIRLASEIRVLSLRDRAMLEARSEQVGRLLAALRRHLQLGRRRRPRRSVDDRSRC